MMFIVCLSRDSERMLGMLSENNFIFYCYVLYFT